MLWVQGNVELTCEALLAFIREPLQNFFTNLTLKERDDGRIPQYPPTTVICV